MKQLQLIEELPDLKIGWYESYKCLDEPLLEYVWEVANHFLPDYEDVSSAPAIFANRYAERNLSVEERYERAKGMKTFKGTLEEYKKREYRKLDDSFKEKFLSNEDLQNTIEAYKLDVSKFWYLLLFVYDFIEDIGTNAPIMGKSVLEDFATFLTNLCDASSITLKQGNKKSYYTEREDLINIIQIAVHHFSESYAKIINSNKDGENLVMELFKQHINSPIYGYVEKDWYNNYGERYRCVRFSPTPKGNVKFCMKATLEVNNLISEACKPESTRRDKVQVLKTA